MFESALALGGARIKLVTSVVLCVAIALGASGAWAQSGGLCEAYHSEWIQVWKELNDRIDEYALAKDEPIAARIQQLLAEQGSRGSMARVVQSALQERSRRMTELRRKIDANLDPERNAFDRWKVCTNEIRRRAGGPARGNPEIQDRERKLARLNDLLLEEAHAQYRNQRVPISADASSYDGAYGSAGRGREWPRQDQPAQYNDRLRFGIDGYGGQLNRIPGYFR